MPTNRHISLPQIAYLRRAFRWSAKEKLLYWRNRPASHFRRAQDALTWNSRYAGQVCGGAKGRGYRMVRIQDVPFQYHRIVYAVVNGRDPGEFLVDHRNGNRAESTTENLRLATRAENEQNRSGANKNSASGVRGVSWSKAASKWCARIMVNGQDIYLGLFDDLETAAKVRNEAARKHHGEFSGSTP